LENSQFTAYNHTWQNRADLSIAQGALTNSKRPECHVKGVYPTHLTRGLGAQVWDAEGRSYIDYICGLGSNLLGYGNELVSRAIERQARLGTSLSLSTTLEVEVAEQVQAMFPFVERLKFLKTGSDACSAAVRIARAATGRELVVSAGYHGWADDFVSLSPPALGVPMGEAAPNQRNWIISEQNAEAVDYRGVAAVIIEAVELDASPERIRWLHELRALCDRTGALLIFDEVITGLRFPGYSVAKWSGVTPDLVCLGKALGNGMPISVVGGRKDVMNCGEYFISTTFAGETVSLAAAQATMKALKMPDYAVDELWLRAGRFRERFNSIWPEGVRIEGYNTRGRFVSRDELTQAVFFQEACGAGVLFGPSWFYSFAHPEHDDNVLNLCSDIKTKLRTRKVALEGEMPQKPFAQRVRDGR
jgi:glutamate-1-semialdehyde 2,1-aminomutase